MSRRLLVVACFAGLAAAFAPTAGADPASGNATAITVVCATQPIIVVMNGNGIFSPLHDVDSTSVFVPIALDVTLTFTFATGGPPAVDHAIVAKNASVQNTVICAIPQQTFLTTPEVSGTITGTIVGFWTPQ
jgi:hypothetical protein